MTFVGTRATTRHWRHRRRSGFCGSGTRNGRRLLRLRKGVTFNPANWSQKILFFLACPVVSGDISIPCQTITLFSLATSFTGYMTAQVFCLYAERSPSRPRLFRFGYGTLHTIFPLVLSASSYSDFYGCVDLYICLHYLCWAPTVGVEMTCTVVFSPRLRPANLPVLSDFLVRGSRRSIDSANGPLHLRKLQSGAVLTVFIG